MTSRLVRALAFSVLGALGAPAPLAAQGLLIPASPVIAIPTLPAQGTQQPGERAGAQGQAAMGQGAQPTSPASVSAPLIDLPRMSTPTIRGGAPVRNDAPARETARAAGVDATAEIKKSPFQEFIEASIGELLPVFGANLFTDSSATFAPAQDTPVTADYVIGAGDEIVVRAWGSVDIDYRSTVDRSGVISIPKVGTFMVAGVRYGDLQSHLQRQVGRVFKNFELAASLGQLRSIRVYVVGQAKRPGAYTVGALSTLVNAVLASGGPSASGSLRKIQLRRGANVVTEFDFYDLLLRGDKSKDVRLASEDVIFIAPVGSQVAIAGAVNAPAVFEIKEGSSLGDLVDWAGGVATTASAQRVTIDRIENRERRRVEETDLTPGMVVRQLMDGDVVTVHAMKREFTNAVTLRGHVAQPVRVPFRPGMRVRDLIPSKEALLTRDFWLARERAARAAPERVELLRLEREVNWEYAAIERMRESDLGAELIPFHLGRAVIDGDAQQNMLLRPGDVITIFSTSDIGVPKGRRPQFVRLEGEFQTPGIYPLQPGESLRQLMARIGAITPAGYLFGMELQRESIRRDQAAKYDEALRRLEREVAQNQAQRSAASPEDAQLVRMQQEAQERVLARLRSVRPSGRLVLKLEPTAQGPRDLPDVPLEDGDRIVVPARPNAVSVFGSVFNEGTFVHAANRRLGDYINNAGGVTRGADTGSVFVIRADGSVESARQSGWWSGIEGRDALPGDTIFVPENYQRQPIARVLRDWSQILYQFGLGAAAIKVLKDR